MTMPPAPANQVSTQVGDLLLSALRGRWDNYRLQVKTCRAEFVEEAVHDLRVAARRLLAVLDLARAVDPHPRIKKIRRMLKDQIDNLDDLRDAQVMRTLVVDALEKLPELKPFWAYLSKREKRLLAQARNQIREIQPSNLKKRIEKISISLESQTLAQGFSASLLGAVDAVYQRAIQAYIQVDAAQPFTVHRLRLAFKKFRYMAEIVHPLFADAPKQRLERMHDYQSRMGDIQDVEILLDAVADFAETHASRYDPEPVRRFFQARRSELLAAFIEDKGELLTFWRAAPDQAFPWETSHDPVPRPTRHRRRRGDA